METSTYQLVWPATGMPEANGVAHGTGDLAGMMMHFTLRPDFATLPPPTACKSAFPFSFALNGIIYAAATR